MQSLKNFFIAFGVGLIIFGIFAYFTMGLIGNNDDKTENPTVNIEEPDIPQNENIFASGNPEHPETSESGNTFTAVIGGYDDSGKELDALIFIKADRENMRFVISSIPTNLKAVITGASGLPEDGAEEIVPEEKVIYTETPVRLKDFPTKFPEECESMIIDTVHLITGMPINYYAFMNSENVKDIFKYTSGLYYNVPKDLVYIGEGTEEEPEISVKAGEQVLTASQAIGFMRFASDTANERTNFNERAKRQSGFIASAMHQVLKRNPEEIITGLGKVLEDCNTNFTVDTFKENFELISKFSEYSANNVTVTFDNYSSEILNYPDTQRRFVNYK